MIGLTVNLVAVLVAAIAAYAMGALWHGFLFQKTWMKLMGFTKKTKGNLTPAKAMIAGFFVTLFASYVIANFVQLLSVSDAFGAFQLAIWGWLGFCMPINLGAYLWENKPFKLFVLNGAFRLVELLILALVLAYWK